MKHLLNLIRWISLFLERTILSSKLFLPVKITGAFDLRLQEKRKQAYYLPRHFPHCPLLSTEAPVRAALWEGDLPGLQEREL